MSYIHTLDYRNYADTFRTSDPAASLQTSYDVNLEDQSVSIVGIVSGTGPIAVVAVGAIVTDMPRKRETLAFEREGWN
jgi:hypothetical protein